MTSCDHCGRGGAKENTVYDLCLCEECWEKHKRRIRYELEALAQVAGQEKYWADRVLPYQYSAPVSISATKKKGA